MYISIEQLSTLIVSRTDSLGDVMLTLPLVGFLKEKAPHLKIYFLGKAYTRALAEACEHVDAFLDRADVLREGFPPTDAILFVFPDKELAQRAARQKIRYRIGTSHRLLHWRYCNRLVHFSRRRSPLHESQLNFKLLYPFRLSFVPTFAQMLPWYGFYPPPLAEPLRSELQRVDGWKVVLHPKSRGSAREWPLAAYKKLAELLHPTQFQIYVTGTAEEGPLIRKELPDLLALPHVHDLTGTMSLPELIAFLGAVDGLVACSTGPLHIAAALGKVAIGLYPSVQPIHPGRWMPIGVKAQYLTYKADCTDCLKTDSCACMANIDPHSVKTHLLHALQEKNPMA